MKIESIAGIAILGIVAYLYFGNKGRSPIPKSDVLDEVIISNIKTQSETFAAKTEERLDLLGAIEQTKRLISIESANAAAVAGKNHTDIFVRTNARNQINFFENQISILQNQLSQLLSKKEDLGLI